MLSAMTTSENFPLINQSRCTPSPTYNPVIQPASTYVATILRQNFQVMSSVKDDSLLKYRLIQEPEVEGGKIAPAISYYLTDRKSETGFSGLEANRPDDSSELVHDDRKEVAGEEVDESKETENDLTDLLDQLELDDSLYEQSKPLKIDPNVLKLDFGKISFSGDLATLEKLYSEARRTSHHLSGGSLVTDASQQGEAVNSRGLCSGGGFLDAGNAFMSGISGLSNQISPSTPLTFDLCSQSESGRGVFSELESTNPFRNSIDFDFAVKTNAAPAVIGEDGSSSFSPTNPFSNLCHSSSHLTGSAVESQTARPQYENVSIPQKSFSQCSTRPASPVLKIPEESSSSTSSSSSSASSSSCVSNPFLLNDTSPDTLFPSAIQVGSTAAPTVRDPRNANFHPNSSSFIFAVPIFPLFQQQQQQQQQLQNITNSSTQTVNPILENEDAVIKRLESRSFTGSKCSPTSSGPVYQNLTNQLEKYVKRNDHSEYDLQCLKLTVKDLRTSGWYYENVSWQESVVLLRDSEPGTFLIRDSSDPNFLFSLSVQTSRGPTSVRLHYVNGQFRLDAEEKLIPHMPSFGSVIELIDYYVEKTVKNKTSGKQKKLSSCPGSEKSCIQKSKNQVWIDSQGNVYSNILLVKPLRRRDHFSSLQHLARLTINTHVKKRSNARVKFDFKVTPVYESSPFQESSFAVNSVDRFCPILSTDALPIPPRLIEYLQDYPYCH